MNKITPRHREIMYQLLAGSTQREIAHELGMSETRLSVLVNSPLFKAELDALQDAKKERVLNHAQEVAEIFNTNSPDAARKIVEHTQSEDPQVSLRASKEVIEYSQFGRDKSKEEAKPIVINQQQMVLIEEGLET